MSTRSRTRRIQLCLDSEGNLAVADARIVLRRDTAAAWSEANPVLLAGEPGVETDTRRFRIGDGVSEWDALVSYPASVVAGGAGA